MPNYTKVQDGNSKTLVVTLGDGETVGILGVYDIYMAMKQVDNSLNDFLFQAQPGQTLGKSSNGEITALGGAIVTIGEFQEYTGHKLGYTEVEALNAFFIIPNYNDVGGGGGNQDPE